LAILVILVLAVLWAAVLLPPILRARNGNGSTGGIGDFVGKLREGFGGHRSADPSLPPLVPIMGPVGGGPMGPMGGPAGPMGGPVGPMGSPARVPGGMTPQQRRRRDVLVGLLAAAGLTFFMALFAGSGIFWVLQLLADALLAGYIYLLLQFKARAHGGISQQQPLTAPAYPPARGPVTSNVANLAAHRREPALSHVDAPREATVLALRRTASY
jgi:hypothetical protein